MNGETARERGGKGYQSKTHTDIYSTKKNMLILHIIKMLVTKLEHLTSYKFYAHPKRYGNIRITDILFAIFVLVSRERVSVDTTATPLSPPLFDYDIICTL